MEIQPDPVETWVVVRKENNMILDTIRIKRHTEGDTRVAKEIPTFNDFDNANRDHRMDVSNLIERFAYLLIESAKDHDWTKIKEPYRSMFYRDMVATMEGRLDFMEGEWAKLHYTELERHHLKKHCPEDVNLFDVIEMICDCVAAGIARSGRDIYDVNISPEILTAAVSNTVEILKDHCEVIDNETVQTR